MLLGHVGMLRQELPCTDLGQHILRSTQLQHIGWKNVVLRCLVLTCLGRLKHA